MSSSSSSLAKLSIIGLFNFSHSPEHIVLSYCDLVCIFLVTNDFEHSFLFSIHISSMVICVKKSKHHLIKLLGFILMSWRLFRCSKYMSFIPSIYFKYFHSVIGLSFITSVFWRLSIFNLEEYYSLMFGALLSSLRNCLIHAHKNRQNFSGDRSFFFSWNYKDVFSWSSSLDSFWWDMFFPFLPPLLASFLLFLLSLFAFFLPLICIQCFFFSHLL